jgi:hypothetical protein
VMTTATGTVIAVCRNANPGLPKFQVDAIYLLEGLGVEGDYHAGAFVRHRSIARRYPTLSNMRQVLIVDVAIYAELATRDIHISVGMLGENVTVEGLAIMQLPTGTRLALGCAVVEVTEIRRPCYQLSDIDARLLKAVVERNEKQKSYKAGIMTRVLQGGWVRPGDAITVLSGEEATF